MNGTSGAPRSDETQSDPVVVILCVNEEFDPLSLLTDLLGFAGLASHPLPEIASPVPPPPFLDRIRPIAFELTPDHKRAVLYHQLDDRCRLPETLAEPRFPHAPGRSSVKRQRLIKRCFRQESEALQEALISAAAYELIDQLAVDESYSMRDCMRALAERCELIEFMRRHEIGRSSFSDEVMNADWLDHSERFRALRNRRWFYKRKALFQAVMRRDNWPVKYWTLEV